ncbi:MAG: SAM-dependent methyltransferase [Burkholderiaceae bacterium]|nr:SAM-dependent methyltransferase [Burkholderiaceae bacterium]
MARQGGWLPFDRFMALALYAPGLGYYARGDRQFGMLPSSGSDFVTAPELSPLFGQALARQIAQALDGSGTDEVWEFGAGSGVLARELLDTLGARVKRYTIVDVSGSLRDKQREVLRLHLDRVRWVDELPDVMLGVVVGNEVLDAMPVQLLHFDGQRWCERGVALREAGEATAGTSATASPWRWADRDTELRPPVDDLEAAFAPGAITEIHPQAEAFVATLADRLQRGAAFFIDYGFPAAEYYHPQRSGGTLMCHRAHVADTDPLADVGTKDITAHVNFTGIAVAGQANGFDVLGYTSQARFLMNCGLLDLLQGADIRTLANAQKLLTEHEMGELFKVIGFARGCDPAFTTSPIGFAHGDRTHTL